MDDDLAPFGARPFLETLQHVEQGGLLAELTDEQARIARAVREHGGKGRLNLVLDYRRTAAGQLQIRATVNAKMPEPERPISVFFVDEEGGLHRDVPGQHRLPLAPVSTGTSKEKAS